MNLTAKKNKNDTCNSTPDEHGLREIWTQSRATHGPKTETMERIRDVIHTVAKQQAKRPLHGHGLAIPFIAWRPIMAAAASLLLLLGAIHLVRQTTNNEQHELAAVDHQITQEIDALQATIWNALAELEDDALSDDFMLQVLTM